MKECSSSILDGITSKRPSLSSTQACFAPRANARQLRTPADLRSGARRAFQLSGRGSPSLDLSRLEMTVFPRNSFPASIGTGRQGGVNIQSPSFVRDEA